jgi:hypothetical protein
MVRNAIPGAAITLLLLVSGCGGGEETTTTPANGTSPAPSDASLGLRQQGFDVRHVRESGLQRFDGQ